ncbi:MAG: hypothetical protein JSU97_08245 [Dehalococcoidia bacterium]|nr:MAG: hypothetical protein JSU97_08245 [Dehalococcoidia bacterium]
MPKLFRKGEEDVGDEPEHAPATVTAEPGDDEAGEEQTDPHGAGTAGGAAKGIAYAAQPKAGTKIIVVADRGATDGHGEAYAFDRIEDAGEFVRGAVEDGMEPSHLHVFLGKEMRLNVAYRVEVNLDPPGGAETAD